MERNGQPATPAAQTQKIVREEGPLATGERFRPFALAALTVALIALCILLAVPFLPAITWGIALAVIAWPMHAWVRSRVIENENWAAGLTSFVVVLAIAVPGVFVTRQIAREAASAADQIRNEQAQGTVRDRLAQMPAMHGVVAWLDRTGVDLDAEARKAVQSYFGDGSAMAQGSVMAVIQAVIAVFILFYMLRDRKELLAGVRRLMPMRKAEAERVFGDAAGSVYANLYATLVTSVIDGVALGTMFWLVGLPSPVTWGVVTFVLSFLPILGTYIVWMPAAIYLALSGHWGGAVALVTYGVASWFIVDNVIYVRVAGDRMHLHQVPALLSFLGGLAVFGASGMILGPAILAVTAAVLEVWHYRVNGEELPKSGEVPAEDAKHETAGAVRPAVQPIP
jgi:predicted PurR-regulated permease PerM